MKKMLTLAELTETYPDSEIIETRNSFNLRWKFAKVPAGILMLPKEGEMKLAPGGLGGKIEVPVAVADVAASMKRDVVANMIRGEMNSKDFRAQKTMRILPLKQESDFAGEIYWRMLREDESAVAATHLLVAARLNPEGEGDCQKTGVGGNIGMAPKAVTCYPTVSLAGGSVFDIYIYPLEVLKPEVVPVVVEGYLVWRREYFNAVAKECEDYARRVAYSAASNHRR